MFPALINHKLITERIQELSKIKRNRVLKYLQLDEPTEPYTIHQTAIVAHNTHVPLRELLNDDFEADEHYGRIVITEGSSICDLISAQNRLEEHLEYRATAASLPYDLNIFVQNQDMVDLINSSSHSASSQETPDLADFIQN